MTKQNKLLLTAFLLFTPFITLAQMCLSCNGMGYNYETYREWEYDGLIKREKIGINHSGTNWYTYRSKNLVKRSKKITCAGCNGSGIQRRMKRVAPKRQGPTVRYVTTTEMIQLSVDRINASYEIKKKLGNRYYYVYLKSLRRYDLVRAKSNELGYEMIVKDIDDFSEINNADGSFLGYLFYDSFNTFFYDTNMNLLDTFSGEAKYTGYGGLFWLNSNNRGMKLYKYDTKKTIVNGDYVYMFTHRNLNDAWKKYGLFTVGKKIQIGENDWKNAIGVMNKNGEFIIPPLFDYCIYDPDSETFLMLDEELNIFYLFGKNGNELIAPSIPHKKCPDGSEIVKRFQYIYNLSNENFNEEGWVYGLESKESNIPSHFSYVDCYDDNGWAKVVGIKSKDTLMYSKSGIKIKRETKNKFAKYISIIKNEIKTNDFPVTSKRMFRYHEKEKKYSFHYSRRDRTINYMDGKPIFEDIYSIQGYSLSVYKEGNLYGLIYFGNSKPKVIPAKYTDFNGYSYNYMLPVKNQKGLWGGLNFLDKAGKEMKIVIPFEYDSIESIGDNYFKCMKPNGKVDYYELSQYKNGRGTFFVKINEIKGKEYKQMEQWRSVAKEISGDLLENLSFKLPNKILKNHKNRGGAHFFEFENGETIISLYYDKYFSYSNITDIWPLENEKNNSSYAKWIVKHKNGKYGIIRTSLRAGKITVKTILEPKNGFSID